jgi:hypothetical protein
LAQAQKKSIIPEKMLKSSNGDQRMLMFGMIIGAVLAFGFGGIALSQQPPPSPSIPSQQEQAQTEPSQQTRDAQQRGTEQSPFIIKIVPAEKTEAEHAEEAKEGSEKAALDRRLVDLTAELARYTGGLFYATVVLAIATILLFIGTIGLIVLSWRQERMARTHERAYVFGGGPCWATEPDGSRKDDFGTMTIENYGRTPAFVQTIEWGLCDEALFPDDTPVSRLIDEKRLPGVETVKTENVYPPNLRPERASKKIEFRLSTNMGKIFFGRFTYLDVFGERHHSTFKLKLVQTGSDPLDGCYSDWS